MSLKASLNGPNRRKQKNTRADGNDNDNYEPIEFQIKDVEALFSMHEIGPKNIEELYAEFGVGCFFNTNSNAGKALLENHHAQIINYDDVPNEADIKNEEPILIHFHHVPVFTIRAIPLPVSIKMGNQNADNVHDNNYMFLSKVQGHLNKVCVDTRMKVTCCSRPLPSEINNDLIDYDCLSHVEVEVYLPKIEIVHNGKGPNKKDITREQKNMKKCFDAKDISRQLMSRNFRSVLTVNELQVVKLDGVNIACRISAVRIKSQSAESFPLGSLSSMEASMEDPYRGRVVVDTVFYITPSSNELIIKNSYSLPKGKLPEDVIHVTTSDMEWFPVRRILLAPCIKLTKYVQVGQGKYKDSPIPTLSEEERSPDAPSPEEDQCPHCKVPMDCCTFDRVLLFIMSILYPEDKQHAFKLENSEINTMAEAAEQLGLMALSDLCEANNSSFESRVRKNEYIRFVEVQNRNNHGELLIILDGMVLDITRWLDEHPGGPSIIPSQAINIDCTVFFEMYHVSRQSFLYLKSFYIGELAPEDILKLKSSGENVSASIGFLQSLRSYTSEWRIKNIDQRVCEKVHKSL